MNKRQTVLILGGGFGGIRCALDLHDRLGSRQNDIDIILVDKRPHQVFYSSLYEVAAAKMPKDAICLPIHKAINKRAIRFLRDSVEQIDPITQDVTLHSHGTIKYDYLVVALGCVPNDFNISGLRDYALTFNSFDNALALRRQAQHHLKTADTLRLVIGGGGPTGVELAAAFRYFAHDFCRHSGQSKDQHLSVTLIELGGRLLNGLPIEMANYSHKKLKKLGVKVFYNTGIQKVKNNAITLTDGNTMPYDLLVWTGGVKPNPIVRAAAFEFDGRGRMMVNKALQARGFSRVYAIGDITNYSVSPKKSLPQVAPHAIWEGEHVASNIYRQITDQQPLPYHLHTFPTLIPLGGNDGILRWNKLIITGRLVLWIKKLVEWHYISGVLPFTAAWHVAVRGTHTSHTHPDESNEGKKLRPSPTHS